ncbi:MAG: gamma-glutamyltransferase [Candidatus Berkiellales bacterium]
MFRRFFLTLISLTLFCQIIVIPTLFAKELKNVIEGSQNDHGAIASAHPLATQAGFAVLAQGGNAFDAAIAVASTLNVVEPAMSGLGGYGSTLVYIKQSGEIRFLNSSGKYPSKANADLMRAPTPNYLENRKGAKSISTPGNLNAWKAMHQQYGKLPWDQLFKGAITYANNGFPLPPYTAKIIANSFDQFSDHAKSIYGKNGQPLQTGDRLIQKDLAKTYELIAKKGVDPFYRGEIAVQIDKQMKALGSFLTIEDLKNDKATWWEPIKINYKGYDVYTIGTPGNGFTALFTLGVMEQFPITKLKHNSKEYLHILAEALKKSVYVRLTHAGSPEEKANINNQILSNDHFQTVAKSIDTRKASAFEIAYDHEGVNTTHFVVVDKWGNIVSSTQTLGLGFGSKLMVEGTGIWMNSSMAFATFEPKGNPLDVFPSKYKLSSNSPIIILKDNMPWATLGTPGGHTIPQNVAQIILNLVDFKMSMQEAIDAPKLAFIAEKNVICSEISGSEIKELEKMGHVIDNQNIESYVGLNGKIGNAMGVRILRGEKGDEKGTDRNAILFEVGIDKRKDAWVHNF